MDDEPVVVTDLPSTEPKEPAVSSGVTVAFATLFVNGLIVLGAPIDAETKTYVVAVVTFLAPIIAGVIIRSKVFSPKTVEQIDAYWKLVVADKDAQLVTARAEIVAAKSVEPIERTLPKLFAQLQAVQPPAPAPEPPVREPQMPQGLAPTDTRAMPQVEPSSEPSAAYRAFMAEQEPVRIPAGDRTRPVPPPERTVLPTYPREYDGYAPAPQRPSEPEGYRRHRRRDTP